MIIGSTKEDLSIEKRIALTPETAKSMFNLGLKVCIEKNYASHLGIEDEAFKKIGVEIKENSNKLLNTCNLLIKVNCPSENEIKNFKEKTILIGMLNPSQTKKVRRNDKKRFIYFLWNFYRELQELNQWMFYRHNLILLVIEL